MKRFVCPTVLAAALAALAAVPGNGAEPQAASAAGKPRMRLTFVLRGAHCAADVKALRAGLAKVKGLKWKPATLQPGKKPRYFSPPVAIEMPAGGDDTIDIGHLAAAVAKVKTPHQRISPPKVNLVLFAGERITEKSVMALR